MVYPSDRKRETPLATFTPVDIVRNTLGVAPCEYVLDRREVETKPTGHRATSQLYLGVP